MSRTIHLVFGLIALFAVLAGATFALTAPSTPSPDAMRPTAELRGAGVLDGMTFIAQLGPAGKPANVEDELVFDDGLFVSVQCEQRCNYPARPYFARRKDALVQFISETRCPNKDAKLVWRGEFDGRTLKGTFTWTTSRWYWTLEKTFWFEGVLSEKSASIASG